MLRLLKDSMTVKLELEVCGRVSRGFVDVLASADMKIRLWKQ